MNWLTKLIPSIGKRSSKSKSKIPDGVWTSCPSCESALYKPELIKTLYVCPKCGHHLRIGARTRLNIFFDPTKGNNFQTDKALAAIKQGGLKGQGMGEGILKESVPEAHTDYIIAVITEEFGSIISIIVITIFLYISYKIIKNCFKTTDESSKIALCGLSSLLIFQTFIHVGVNTSLLPTTGMTLPFLSYGGSSLIGSSNLAGVILNFTKNRFENE